MNRRGWGWGYAPLLAHKGTSPRIDWMVFFQDQSFVLTLGSNWYWGRGRGTSRPWFILLIHIHAPHIDSLCVEAHWRCRVLWTEFPLKANLLVADLRWWFIKRSPHPPTRPYPLTHPPQREPPQKPTEHLPAMNAGQFYLAGNRLHFLE